MALIVYATTEDLTTPDPPWVATPPDNAGALLRWASIRVANACARDLYTDSPSQADAEVLRDATCAQVAAWVTLGIDPAMLGTDFPAPVKSSSMLGDTVARDTSGQTKAIGDAAEGLADLARDILLSAGLLWQPVPIGADVTDPLPQWGAGQYAAPWIDPLSGEIDWPEPVHWPYG